MARTRTIRALVCLAATSVIAVATAPSASAEEGANAEGTTTVPTSTTLTGDSSGYVGHITPLRVTVADGSGAPVPNAVVTVQRHIDEVWRTVATVTTDDGGLAAVTAPIRAERADNAFRAVTTEDADHTGSTSPNHVVQPVKYTSQVTVTGPGTVVDERAAVLTLTWRAAAGDEVRPVRRTLKVYRKQRGTWRRVATVRPGPAGVARLRVRPRYTTRWKAVGAAGPWFTGDASNVHRLRNLPPGLVVRLPKGSPQPDVEVAPQRRAVGAGANLRVTRIPNPVWKDMVGVSWTSRCPVGRDGLRLIRINYWGYDGYRHRGELVLSARVAYRVGKAFAALYRHRVPIRSMYRVDRFGYNSTLRGGDDYESMAAGNTSGFNCRGVANNPSTLSPHSVGTSIDINTWENPYASRYPNTYWRHHQLLGAARVVTWRSKGDLVPRILRGYGIRWTYGLSDIHHFDA